MEDQCLIPDDRDELKCNEPASRNDNDNVHCQADFVESAMAEIGPGFARSSTLAGPVAPDVEVLNFGEAESEKVAETDKSEDGVVAFLEADGVVDLAKIPDDYVGVVVVLVDCHIEGGGVD